MPGFKLEDPGRQNLPKAGRYQCGARKGKAGFVKNELK